MAMDGVYRGKPGSPLDEKKPSPKGRGSQIPYGSEAFNRPANEDDDGYDPWSDRSAKDPFWEDDPWA